MALRSLSMRVAVPAGLFTLISVAVLVFALIRVQRDALVDEIVRGSESISGAMLLSLERDMRDNRSERVQDVVYAMGSHTGIERIRLYNKAGRIAYSSRPDEVGQTVDSRAEACVQCHRGGATPAPDVDPHHRSRIYTNSAGQPMLGTISVVRNRTGCQGAACHASVADQKVLGVLDVTTSLEPAWARLAASTRRVALLGLLAVVVITTVLVLVIGRSVRRPLNRLLTATRRVAALKPAMPPSVALPPDTAYEIGILAGAFNDMAESLVSSNTRLEEWAASLEERMGAKARELREARAQIVQAEKLSSVGLVAAGIAHELNSPLMAIITFAHLIRGTLPPEGQAQDDLRMIEREAKRCATIIRQLLDFSRKQSEEPAKAPCHPGVVVRRALDLLKGELQKTGVVVSVTADEELAQIEANEAQLMQVFVNLALNAIQAMPDGGELAVAAATVDRHACATLDLPRHAHSEVVCIKIRDTGTGIARAHLDKVFDPFFTTKPVGKGSGLGLSVSLGIVRGIGGTIAVDSDGESWTEFTVFLPACEQPAMAMA